MTAKTKAPKKTKEVNVALSKSEEKELSKGLDNLEDMASHTIEADVPKPDISIVDAIEAALDRLAPDLIRFERKGYSKQEVMAIVKGIIK